MTPFQASYSLSPYKKAPFKVSLGSSGFEIWTEENLKKGEISN
jgi:hypothetical protein